MPDVGLCGRKKNPVFKCAVLMYGTFGHRQEAEGALRPTRDAEIAVLNADV